jgi:hypothetical protein
MSGSISLLQPPGLFVAPFFSHVAVVPPGARTIYVEVSAVAAIVE